MLALLARYADDLRRYRLRPFDPASKQFRQNYKDKTQPLMTGLKNTQAQLATTQKALKASQADYTAYQTKIETYYKNALGSIVMPSPCPAAMRSKTGFARETWISA